MRATKNQAPIVAVITAEIHVGDKLLVPEGTLIHGTTGNIFEDRLHAQPVWRFTLSGKTHTITASVLEAAMDDSGRFQFGAAGLPGKRLDNPNRHMGRIFAATAIAAASRSLKQTSNGILGNTPSYLAHQCRYRRFRRRCRSPRRPSPQESARQSGAPGDFIRLNILPLHTLFNSMRFLNIRIQVATEAWTFQQQASETLHGLHKSTFH